MSDESVEGSIIRITAADIRPHLADLTQPEQSGCLPGGNLLRRLRGTPSESTPITPEDQSVLAEAVAGLINTAPQVRSYLPRLRSLVTLYRNNRSEEVSFTDIPFTPEEMSAEHQLAVARLYLRAVRSSLTGKTYRGEFAEIKRHILEQKPHTGRKDMVNLHFGRFANERFVLRTSLEQLSMLDRYHTVFGHLAQKDSRVPAILAPSTSSN